MLVTAVVTGCLGAMYPIARPADKAIIVMRIVPTSWGRRRNLCLRTCGAVFLTSGGCGRMSCHDS